MRDEKGQTLPLYVMAITGFLFLAFAFFAVGQAATVRNGAQSAADAAALAAAQDARDDLLGGFLDALVDSGDWSDWLGGGKGLPSGSACDEAARFADRNRADVLSCGEASGKRGYTVEVLTRYTVGESIIPGTESRKGRATATAVIEPRCSFDERAGGNENATGNADENSGEDADENAGENADENAGEDADENAGENADERLVEFTCDGQDWSIDPDGDDPLPDAADLFSVHLDE